MVKPTVNPTEAVGLGVLADELETLGLPVFVVEKRQPAADSEAIITSAIITTTFLIMCFASISS